MAVIVQKYGGSSVADLAKLKLVAAQVVARRRAGDRVVVVVSAMGKTTDQLISQAREVCADPPRRELDMLVTAGERISMALLSMAIHATGEQAISFTGSQSGIITDDNHQGARILEVRPHRIQRELDAGKVVIVAGYQGVSLRHEVTTLGRGGSDTTAVALAAALQADACEIYSDVDGVYSADPNVCPQARLLPELRYEIMQAMAGAGAKVLNADAVEFARRAGIAIFARKTADGSGRQTVVKADAAVPQGVVAVVGAKVVTQLLGDAADLPQLLQHITALGGKVMVLGDGELLIDRTGIPGHDATTLVEVAGRAGLRCQAVGVVTLVGSGLLAGAGVWPVAAAALAGRGIAVAGRTGNDSSLAVLMAPGDVDAAVSTLHAQLIGPAAAR